MKKNSKFSTYDLVVVAIMAAFVFVATNFRINIPMPIGKAMLHFGNVFCLMSGMLLGPMRGGLAAGFGSFLFDMTSDYVSSAPFTLVFKFLMAFVCGSITHSGGHRANSKKLNLVGAICGSLTYSTLYLSKAFINGYYFMRYPMETVMADVIAKLYGTVTQAIIAIIVSLVLLPIFSMAMKRAGIYAKLFPEQDTTNLPGGKVAGNNV